MLHQQPARVAASGHDIDDPGREPGLLDQRHHLQDRGAGQFGWFDHEGVAGGNGKNRAINAVNTGEFHGTITATTPSGSGLV